MRSNTPRNVAPFDGCHRPSRNGPRTSANRRASHGHPAREREAGSRSWRSAGAVSPSMTVPATAPRRPFSAHSSLFGRHISTTVSAGKPSAKSKRADITKGHALSHSTRSPKRAVHFRPLAVASITIRNGAADLIGIVGLNCSTILRHLGVVCRTTLWNIVPVTVATLLGLRG